MARPRNEALAATVRGLVERNPRLTARQLALMLPASLSYAHQLLRRERGSAIRPARPEVLGARVWIPASTLHHLRRVALPGETASSTILRLATGGQIW